MPATPGIWYWLVDTRRPVDLVGKKTLPTEVIPFIAEALDSHSFDFGNRPLLANEEVCMQVEGTGDQIICSGGLP